MEELSCLEHFIREIAVMLLVTKRDRNNRGHVPSLQARPTRPTILAARLLPWKSEQDRAGS